MLVVTRKTGEGIVIDGDVKVTVLEVSKDKIKLGIEAPRDVKIVRSELFDTEKLNLEAAASVPSALLEELLRGTPDKTGKE